MSRLREATCCRPRLKASRHISKMTEGGDCAVRKAGWPSFVIDARKLLQRTWRPFQNPPQASFQGSTHKRNSKRLPQTTPESESVGSNRELVADSVFGVWGSAVQGSRVWGVGFRSNVWTCHLVLSGLRVPDVADFKKLPLSAPFRV